nr:hypothetical protein RKHAN_02523 [Rhizobium sp. Khangiran2]
MRTPYFQDLADFETRLSSHFSSLRSARGGTPIFLIEHGLDQNTVSELQSLVGRKLRLVGVNPIAWAGNYLPLGIAVTEVGYRYRGTGTDFWPKVDEALNVSISISERPEVSGIFRWLSDRLGFARPHTTQWSTAYTHIAWPIRNALVPIEIHRPLLSALGQVLASGASLRDDALLHTELLAISDGLWSQRLRDWLEDAPLAIELCRKLLLGDEQTTWLEPVFITRIAKDLRSDPQARRSLVTAKRIAARERQTTSPQPDASQFMVSVTAGQSKLLLLRGPSLREEFRQAIMSRLRGSCDLVAPGSRQGAVPVGIFLSGALIDLGQPTECPQGSLIRLIGDSAPVTELEKLAAALEPMPPLAFAWDGLDGFATSIGAGEKLPARHKVILLSWDGKYAGRGLHEMPSWPGVSTYVLDSSDPVSSGLLRELGITVADQPLLSFAGGAVVARWHGRIHCVEGLPLLCRSIVRGSLLTLCGSDGTMIASYEGDAGEIISLGLPAGEYLIVADTNIGKHTTELLVLPPPDEYTFKVALDPPSGQIDDLLADSLSVILRSPVALQGVNVDARIFQDGIPLGQPVNFTCDAPGRIDARSGPIQQLKELVLASCGNRLQNLEVELELDCLGTYRWSLERAPRSFDFDFGHQAWRNLDNQLVEGSVAATSSAPIIASAPRPIHWPAPELSLLMPRVQADETLLCGIAAAPRTMRIGIPEQTQPFRPARSLEDFEGRPGFQGLSTSYLAWRVAQPEHLIADRQRKTVCETLESALVEQFCGPEWRGLEAKGEVFSGNAYDALVRICFSRRLASGPRFPEVSPEETSSLYRELRRLFQEGAPNLGVMLANGSSFEVLDFAINEAYETLRAERQARELPPFEELDIYNDDASWQEAIKSALGEALRPAFRPLLLPASRWIKLSNLDYKKLGQDEVVQALWECHLDASRTPGYRWLGRRELRSGLQLWIAPRDILATSGWRDDLIKLLSDRQTARAIRYTALRLRAETQTNSY